MQIAAEATIFQFLLFPAHPGYSGFFRQSLSNGCTPAQINKSRVRPMSFRFRVGAADALAGGPGGECASRAAQLFRWVKL